MVKSMIECVDPDNIDDILNAVYQSAGKCSITYYNQAKEMVEVGTAKSIYDAVKKIAADTGETVKAVERRVYKGKGEIPPVGEKRKNDIKETEITQEIKEIMCCKCGKHKVRISRQGKPYRHGLCQSCRKKEKTNSSREPNVSNQDQFKNEPSNPEQIISQKKIWGEIECQLQKITDYIEQHAETAPPPGYIDFSNIKFSMTALNIYLEGIYND